jgi:hypothetical protein
MGEDEFGRNLCGGLRRGQVEHWLDLDLVIGAGDFGLGIGDRHLLGADQSGVRRTAPRQVQRAVETASRQPRRGIGLAYGSGMDDGVLQPERTRRLPAFEHLVARHVGVGERRCGRDVRPVGLAPEQQTGERRVLAIPRGCPPQHQLGASTRHRDVGQPQVLLGFLHPRLRASLFGACDVEASLCVLVVEVRGHPVLDPSVEKTRQVDEGVFEAFRTVDRHELHGLGIDIESPTARVGAIALIDRVAQPASQTGQAQAVLLGGAMEQLAHVVEVGKDALTALPAQHSCGQPVCVRSREHGGDST